MTIKEDFRTVWYLIQRQVGQMLHNHIYIFCMIVFPLLVTFFFSDLMKNGLPTDMPAGVVDLDNSYTSRKIIRNLDAFQNTRIKAYYPNVSEARHAVQRGDIYGFFYFPAHMNDDLLASRQPTVSFYYNNGMILAGSLMFKDMSTIATLGGASVASYKMAANGYTEKQIMANIQPIAVDVHITHNPTLDYDVYLSTSMIPTCLGIFIFLITVYSIGTELKFNHAKDWMRRSGNNIYLAILGKMIPQTMVFTLIVFIYILTLFGYMGFPHYCSTGLLLFNGFLFVLAAEGFGIFMFGILPSLRMSMSICALWSVVSFSISGFTFPVDTMDIPLQMLSWLFPMRHYYMIYQMVVLNGYPVYYAWSHYIALLAFALVPLLVFPNIKKAMLKYVYIP